MAISFVGAELDNLANGDATGSPAIHTDAIEDDLMIGWCGTRQGNAVWNDDGAGGQGWTRLLHNISPNGDDRTISVFYKFHDGSETNPTFTRSLSSNQPGVTAVAVYRGVDTTTPFDVTYVEATHFLETLNNMLAANRAITTVNDNAWVLLLQYATRNEFGTPGAPTNYTLDLGQGGANQQNFAIATRAIASASAETPGVWTHSGTAVSADSSKVTLALREAAAGGANPHNPFGHPFYGPFAGPIA